MQLDFRPALRDWPHMRRWYTQCLRTLGWLTLGIALLWSTAIIAGYFVQSVYQ